MIYKISFFSIICISFFFLLSPVTKVFAHPIDNTYTYLIAKEESDGSVIADNELVGYFYINWFIVGSLYTLQTGQEPDSFELLADNIQIPRNYVLEKVRITNNGEQCLPTLILYDNSESQITSLDAEVIYKYKCNSKIENINISNSMATDLFPLVSNYVSIQKGQEVLEKVTLGKSQTTLEFNLQNLIANPVGDISYDFSQGMDISQIVDDTSVIDKLNTNLQDIPTETGNNLTSPRKKNYLSSLVDQIFSLLNNIKNGPPYLLFCLIFMLGFLHTLEAGHSKAILAANMINSRMNLRRGIAYVFIFTGAHIGDIILIGALFLFVNNFYDIFSNFTLIERFSGYIILLLSVFLIYKGIKSIRDARERRKLLNTKVGIVENNSSIVVDNTTSFKEQIVMGIITGIAPCIFGWSIFLLVISTGNVWMLIPAVIFFGLGIFVALLLVVLLISAIKSKTYSRLGFVSEYSQLFSAVLLLIYSLVIIF